jgi:threonine synthase
MAIVAQSKREQTTVPGVDRHGANGAERVYLRCAHCGHEVVYSPAEEQCGVCGCEWLDLVYRGVTRDDIITNSDPLGRTSMWRYRKFLPVLDDRNIVSMGEGMTPLLRVDRLAAGLGLHNVYIKIF